MGLENQLSDSIIIYGVVIIAKSLRYLHSLICNVLHTVGLLSPPYDNHQVYDVVGSGLAGLILLCEQLNMNRDPVQLDGVDWDCVVCLNRLGEGEVRELACGHVFHKDCLHGWLHNLKFSCPICRQPLVQNDRVDCTQRRVTRDLLAWFPFQ